MTWALSNSWCPHNDREFHCQLLLQYRVALSGPNKLHATITIRNVEKSPMDGNNLPPPPSFWATPPIISPGMKGIMEFFKAHGFIRTAAILHDNVPLAPPSKMLMPSAGLRRRWTNAWEKVNEKRRWTNRTGLIKLEPTFSIKKMDLNLTCKVKNKFSPSSSKCIAWSNSYPGLV